MFCLTALLGGILCSFSGCFDKESQGPGNSTEAENALAFLIVDENCNSRQNVRASLCEKEAACSNPVGVSISDDSGKILIENIPDGSYFLTCSLDQLQKSMKVSLSGGDTLNLGRVEFTESGLTILKDSIADSVSVWAGKWTYQSADTNTEEESITTEEIGFLFSDDSSLTYWTYSWTVGYGSNILAYAPSESLFVEAKWNDAGTFLELVPSLADGLSDSLCTFYSNVHILLMPVTSTHDVNENIRWTGGFIFYPMEDSLLFMGDVDVYEGTATALVGTWTNAYAQANIESLEIAEGNGIAITQDGITYTGVWSVSESRLEFSWDVTYTDGSTTSYTISKLYSIVNGKLLLIDFDDETYFYRQK